MARRLAVGFDPMNLLASLRSRADIPNSAGFVLVLVREDGTRQLSRVAVDGSGCHYCATPSGKRVDLTGKSDERSPVAGWLPHEEPKVPSVPGYVASGARPAVHTGDELRVILASWGAWQATGPITFPRPGQTVCVNLPRSDEDSNRIAVIERATSPATDKPAVGASSGKPLFNVWTYSPED